MARVRDPDDEDDGDLSAAADPDPAGDSDAEALFQAAMSGVRALARVSQAPRAGARRPLLARDAPPADASEAAAEEGAQPGVDRRLLGRLRSGSSPAEAELDLHGLDVAAAELALEQFVWQAQRVGCRNLLVITGQGLHSAGGESVLRPAVCRWLASRLGVGAELLAYCPAAPSQGGRGAFALLLKR